MDETQKIALKNYVKQTAESSAVKRPMTVLLLNPQEHVWKAGRKAATHNKHITDIEQAAQDFVAYITSRLFSYDDTGNPNGDKKAYKAVSQLDWDQTTLEQGKLVKLKGFPGHTKVKLFCVIIYQPDRLCRNQRPNSRIGRWCTKSVCHPLKD